MLSDFVCLTIVQFWIGTQGSNCAILVVNYNDINELLETKKHKIHL